MYIHLYAKEKDTIDIFVKESYRYEKIVDTDELIKGKVFVCELEINSSQLTLYYPFEIEEDELSSFYKRLKSSYKKLSVGASMYNSSYSIIMDYIFNSQNGHVDFHFLLRSSFEMEADFNLKLDQTVVSKTLSDIKKVLKS